jgi:hypothetical protein
VRSRSRGHEAPAAHGQPDRRGAPRSDGLPHPPGRHGLYGVYGGEITGKSLSDIYSTSAADYWRAELGKVIAERKPTVGVHNLAWRGASHLSILWLRLPLAANGSEVDMILGYDAVVGMGHMATGIRAA